MKPPIPLLLVVADVDRRCRLRQHLAGQGFRVFATGSTSGALAWLDRHDADVVVADWLLPGTRIALPHHLKRHARTRPRLIGLVDGPLTPSERLRELLGYDLLLSSGTPAVVLTRRILERPGGVAAAS